MIKINRVALESRQPHKDQRWMYIVLYVRSIDPQFLLENASIMTETIWDPQAVFKAVLMAVDKT